MPFVSSSKLMFHFKVFSLNLTQVTTKTYNRKLIHKSTWAVWKTFLVELSWCAFYSNSSDIHLLHQQECEANYKYLEWPASLVTCHVAWFLVPSEVPVIKKCFYEDVIWLVYTMHGEILTRPMLSAKFSSGEYGVVRFGSSPLSRPHSCEIPSHF